MYILFYVLCVMCHIEITRICLLTFDPRRIWIIFKARCIIIIIIKVKYKNKKLFHSILSTCQIQKIFMPIALKQSCWLKFYFKETREMKHWPHTYTPPTPITSLKWDVGWVISGPPISAQETNGPKNIRSHLVELSIYPPAMGQST